MATVQTLKDKDNNTFYPVTKTEAVYNGDGSKTLDYILDNTIIASEDPADANKVFKGNASLGLVGSDNVDFNTDGFSYKVGDTITLSTDWYVAGRVTTTGSPNVSFNIVLPKRINNVSTLNISGTIYVYYPGGDVHQTVNLDSASKMNAINAFRFNTDIFNSALASATKPCPLTIDLNTCTLTFR